MKLKYIYMSFAAATLLLAGCSNDEAYDTEVTRDIQVTLDGQPWSVYYGTSGRPLFIYGDDGEYVANYSTNYRFSLPNGGYKIFATANSSLIDIPQELGNLVVPQDTLLATTLGISTPAEYHPGEEMKLDMLTRTGVLRLHSTDSKADRSYSSIRATITTPVTGYKVEDATYVVDDNNPLVLTHTKASSNGGINFNDDMVLMGTKDDSRKVNVSLDYLDGDGNVVRTRTFDDGFDIVPGDSTIVEFALNNADEPVIMDYHVRLASADWTDENVSPGAPLVIPDGYTYVDPQADLTSVISEQMADDTIDTIRVFLKAGESYTLENNALSNLTKAISIKGQTPSRHQEKATLSLGAITPNGNLGEIEFCNLNFQAGSRLFNVRNQTFDIAKISFQNCEWDSWSGIIWYQNTSSTSVTQHIGTMEMDGCTMTGWQHRNNPLLGMPSRNPAKVDVLRLHNNNFSGNFSSRDAIFANYGDATLDISGNNF